MMLYRLQQSEVEDCKQTNFAFYQSIVITILSMINGLVVIGSMLI